jgi:hypothetical protein
MARAVIIDGTGPLQEASDASRLLPSHSQTDFCQLLRTP